ncbi:hypothetical protein Tco_0344630 [Tanacetum coccineum]
MEIFKDQSGNTLKVSQSRFYNGKLVHTLLEGYSILSLEGSLSRDYDVEKNGKWSCIYAVGSQEYQVVCTRPNIAFADVGCKGDYLAKGTLNRVMIQAKDSSGYHYRCIVKGYPWFEVPALVEAAAYRRFLI